MSNDKLIPELRFPEFKNEGEWEINEFGELINVLADYTANGSFASLKENVTYYSSEEYAVLVRTTDLDKKIFTPARFTDKRGYDFLSKTSLFGNEIVMANVGSIGKVFKVPYYEKPMTLAPNTYVLKFNDFVEEDFIFQMMLRSEFEKQLLSMVGSSTLMAINKSNLRSIKVAVPKKIEQQKIASCLSSLDEVIAAHSQKLELLKDHKKGLMQNLFPQEGERVPKYRFKEFEKDGEWVEKPLDDVCKLVRGPFGGALKKEIFVKEGFAVYEQSHAIYSDFSSFRYYIDEEKFNELKRFSVKSGDLIMSCSGTMGKFAIVPEDYKIGVINQALLKLTAKKGYDNLFVKMTLEADNNQEKLLSQSAGGAIKNVVSVSQIRELALFIPSIKEQQKVASCLSSIDTLITAQDKKIEQLQMHKKGLMQGLFPKIND